MNIRNAVYLLVYELQLNLMVKEISLSKIINLFETKCDLYNYIKLKGKIINLKKDFLKIKEKINMFNIS